MNKGWVYPKEKVTVVKDKKTPAKKTKKTTTTKKK